MQAWQASLASLSSELAGDTVVDVFGIGGNKALLLTQKHMVYLKARTPNMSATTYRLK